MRLHIPYLTAIPLSGIQLRESVFLYTKSFIQDVHCIVVYRKEKKFRTSLVGKCLINYNTFKKKEYDIEVKVNEIKLIHI